MVTVDGPFDLSITLPTISLNRITVDVPLLQSVSCCPRTFITTLTRLFLPWFEFV